MEEYLIRSAVLTHPGRKRPHNEDFVAFFEPDNVQELLTDGRLYIVADGVGGAAKGERASQYAARKVLYEYYQSDEPDSSARLQHIIRRAGNDIFDYIEKSGRFTQMATTMVTAVVRNGLLTVANVGDSRAYLIRDGQAQQITRDHTLAGEMLRNGEITEEEAINLRGKNRITRSLGGEPDVHVDIFPDITLRPGDQVLLCSDGLSRYTLAEDIAQLAAEGRPEEVVQRCVNYANRKGGVDNISVIVIQVGEPVADLAATHHVAAGHAPAPVDWDTIETDPALQPVAAWRNTRRLAILGAVGLVAVLLLAAVVLFLLGVPPWQGSTDEASATVTTQPTVETTTGQPGISPVDTKSAATTAPPAAADLPTDLPTPTPELIPEGQWCVYTVMAGGPRTVKDVVMRFAGDEDPEQYREAVFSDGGNLGAEVWGWDETLKLGARLVLARRLVDTVEQCVAGGGQLSANLTPPAPAGGSAD